MVSIRSCWIGHLPNETRCSFLHYISRVVFLVLALVWIGVIGHNRGNWHGCHTSYRRTDNISLSPFWWHSWASWMGVRFWAFCYLFNWRWRCSYPVTKRIDGVIIILIYLRYARIYMRATCACMSGISLLIKYQVDWMRMC